MAEGRRGRLRNRIRNEGVTHLEPHEALEAMLYPFIPRIDTAGIARRLLKKYGSLYGVVHADSDELFREKHMTRLAAKMLPFQYRAFDYLTGNYIDERVSLFNPAEMCKYALQVPAQFGKEGLYLVLMDGQYRLIYSELIMENNPDAEMLSVRKIMPMIVNSEAKYLSFVHTHPVDKLLLPSPMDFHLIRTVGEVLKGIDVNINDYVVVFDNLGLSFKQLGLLEENFSLAKYTRYNWLENCTRFGYFKEENGRIEFLSYHDYDVHLKKYYEF